MVKRSSPTFAIMGSGGMGGYIGAKLAKAEYQVSFLARGTHLESMKNDDCHLGVIRNIGLKY